MLVVRTVAVMVWLAFTVWTVCRLSRRSVWADETVGRRGIGRVGAGIWVVGTSYALFVVWQAKSDGPILFYAIVFGVELLPMCLWGGFLWGEVMGSLFPREC